MKVRLLKPHKLHEKLTKGEDLIVLDVRKIEEFTEGRIEGSILLPHEEISEKIEAILTDKGAFIVAHCRGGVRSEVAVKAMQTLGYSEVYSLEGGIEAWKKAALPTVFPKK